MFADFLRVLFFPLVGSAAMAAVVFAVRERLTGLPGVVELVVLVGVGAAVYGVVMFGLERQVGIGLDEMYRTIRNSVR